MSGQLTDSATSANIVLTTLNARYIHSSFGLRYLKANMGDLQGRTHIVEFTLESRSEDIAEQLLSLNPTILLVSIYIWNTVQSFELISLIRAIEPDLPIIIGGPEVSYEVDSQPVFSLVDFVVTGWGDVSVAKLCRQLLTGQRPTTKVIEGEQPKLCEIKMPYHLYTDEDIKNRVIYVEASRGCPYKCEFCLSALDKTAWPFDTDLFLDEMDKLYQRGARQFKFVDRTFNLNIKVSLRILEFFLRRMDEKMFLHFELIPDHLPDALKETIKRFPKNRLQFEIGIQTFNEDVQKLISRRQKNDKAAENLRWLLKETNAYIHADLIFGLPGEGMTTFGDSFNQLYALRPHEIQVGILKRLKGSPIIRHAEDYQLRFNPNPPFNVLSTRDASFEELQRMNRFARYWDMIGNSGRFAHTLPLLLSDDPFNQFMMLTDGLFAHLRQTHKISLLRLFDALYDVATQVLRIPKETLYLTLNQDFANSGLKSRPKYILRKESSYSKQQSSEKASKRNQRQARHEF